MKKVILVLLITLLGAFITTSNSSCLGVIDSVDGNGNVIKQERSVSGFSAIQVGGAFEIYLSQGENESLTLEADENLMDYIVTEVRGNELVIRTEKSLRDYRSLKVYLTFKELDMMDFSGAVEVYSSHKLVFSDLVVESSGASDIELQFEAASLSMGLSGASEINLSGYCREAHMESSGASELDAEELETESFTMEISGAGEARVFVTQKLDVSISGAADVRYKGNPSTVNQRTSGAGSISRID